ncbi:hypothetical protein OE494_32775 [Pseudomonas aeruginosa]|uniref:hypothetical protein n=1 Tax=Pseudomonas aeruginosa TaxID=287 RepID=UPI0012949531|nr:hypothetical protein [Pseudomonas aeruginosa]EIU2642788.1 hypothetical protein [Pseudomonas aeruginosa]EIU4985969.1 hypothetical protein [Pseudomonas aeruginosa]EIU9544700.1 hypothetical protein [Pseudomonas aeruginosa]EIU9549681.1 hypothetical protein [Pseudomonas aeruginosa]EIY2515812.1 hypothetical protein [Pseudomonas aeruginosa]
MKLDRDHSKDRGETAIVFKEVEPLCCYPDMQDLLGPIHVSGDAGAYQSVLMQIFAAPGHVLVFIEKIGQVIEVNLPWVRVGQPIKNGSLHRPINFHFPGLRWLFRVEAKSYHGCAGLHLPPIPRVARG